jgi:hypothetical protein
MPSQTRWREASGAVAIAAAVVFGTHEAATAAEQRVQWTNTVNVAERGNGLQKVNGCEGCDDASAVSRQMIRSGDGYAEFIIGEPYTVWIAGLGRSDGNAHFNDIDFAFRFNGNDTADVVENGQYQGGDTPYGPGDRFRIAVVADRVRYMKNDSVVFESRRAPRYPLVLKTAFGTMGASMRNARIETNGRAFTNDRYYYEPDRYSRRGWGETGTSGQLITVYPTERWTDTGMYVEAGDMITIDAEGSIQMSGDGGDTATPAGSRTGRRALNAPLRNQPAGILIARIGNSGVVAVGDRRTARAPISGELYLGVNDDVLGDNRGEYRVSVTVNPR